MADEATARDLYTCPRCGERTTKSLLGENRYCCTRCAFEAAHVEVATNGAIRRVLGWLRSPGDLLHSRYQVTGVLGKGGFAATYLVEDLLLKGKRRAVKEMPEDLYDEYETSLLSALDHPAIPDICDRFEDEGMVYLVLEFGGTRTLEAERRAKGGTVPVDTLLAWTRELCDVLAYLHGRVPPVVHRDLKPENVLLDDRGRVMLIDFGIAKESQNDTATRTIARSASHGFSPPEQAMGHGTDQRSDVYALGATMYTLLTGQVPPAAHERVAGAVLAPPSSLNPAVAPALETVILRALELNVNARQQSITELVTCLASPEAQATPVPQTFARTQRLAPGAAASATTAGVPEVNIDFGSATMETVATPAPRPPMTAIVIAGAVALVVLGAIGWWWLGVRTPENQTASVPSEAQASPAAPAPAVSAAPPAARGVENVPNEQPQPQSPPPPQYAAPAPGVAPNQPPIAGESAASVLERRKPEPALPLERREPAQPKVVAERRPPVPQAPPPPPAKAPPKSGGAGSWGGIEYKGAQQQ